MTGVVVSASLSVAGGADDLNNDSPIVGYQQLVTAGNVSASTEETDFPASNLANPITHLQWRAATATDDNTYITVLLDTSDNIDYLAIAAHNFGSGEMPISVEGLGTVDSFTKLLLHFDGADASTTFTDSSASAHTFTANGNAQLDTAEFQFGTAAGLFDGTGDYLSTPDSTDFTLGTSDFTIEGWFNCTAATGADAPICGQVDATFTAAGSAWDLMRLSSGVVRFEWMSGGSFISISGTTQFSNLLNTGWHHVAAVRFGNIFMLFIDGALEASTTSAVSINNSSANLEIGRCGAATPQWKGWLDEIRMSVGVARWTADFEVPQAEYPWTELASSRLLDDDGPVIFRFSPAAYVSIRLRIQASRTTPQLVPMLGVMYVGLLLYMQRRIYVGHTPLPLGRKQTTANLRSIAGGFLGRIIDSRTRQSAATFQNLTPAWYRTYLDPFLIDAQDNPFFFAWRPGSYPNEAGFAWMTNDPVPDNQRGNGMMQITLEMEGIA